MRTRITILSLVSVLALAACSSSNDLGAGKTGKAFTVQGYSYDQVWQAALAGVREETGDQKLEIEKNLTITKEEKSTGTINAATGMSLLSWGEVVGVFVSPAGEAPSHRVEVESLSKLKTNVFANNWEDEIITRIKNKLAATPRVQASPQPIEPGGLAPVPTH